MYTLYKFHFLNGISEINQLFDDILIIWPAPVYIYIISVRQFAEFLFIVKRPCSRDGRQRILCFPIYFIKALWVIVDIVSAHD